MTISEFKPEFQKAVDHLHRELANLRTGRAHPAMLDAVRVDAYGTEMELKGVASITVPDPRTLQIEPWDKSLLKAVEKGIVAANLGLNPTVDSSVVRIALPRLTEENRKDLVKIMRGKLEEAKVSVRGVREKARAAIIEAERGKTISEDERYRLQEDLEKETKRYIEEIESVGGEKEKEIMTV